MTGVKVVTIGATFDGRPIGTIIELSEEEATHYEAVGYVVRVKEEPEAAQVKKVTAPKKPAKATDKKKTQDK